jgi:D-amino-acid dehydrogenase
VEPDVLVLGGGMVGLFCAYFLRRDGHSVVLVERGPIGGPQSCSAGNTGFVGTQGAAPLAGPGMLRQGFRGPDSPLYIKPRLDPELLRWLRHFRRACNAEDAKAGFQVLLDLKRRSLGILREVCATEGLQLNADGLVLAFKTQAGFDHARRAAAAAVAGGVPLRELDRDALAELELDVAGALFNEEGAFLDAAEFLRGFARVLAAMGVEVVAETEVLELDVAGDDVRRVVTSRGEFRPGETVVAAGTWSAGLLRRLRLDLMVQPVKGYAITVKAPANAPRLPIILSEGRVAVAPLGDRLRFGGTLELAGYDVSVARRRVEAMLRTVRASLPGLEIAEAQDIWTGLRPSTPDSLPLLGRPARFRNLTIASGHGHIGMGLAPAGGQLVAQLIGGQEPEMDPRPFHPDRFVSPSGRKHR